MSDSPDVSVIRRLYECSVIRISAGPTIRRRLLGAYAGRKVLVTFSYERGERTADNLQSF